MTWYQKSRSKWLLFRDKNTKYFYLITVIYKKRNSIENLRNDNGEWIDNDEKLKNRAVDFYKRLFSKD